MKASGAVIDRTNLQLISSKMQVANTDFKEFADKVVREEAGRVT